MFVWCLVLVESDGEALAMHYIHTTIRNSLVTVRMIVSLGMKA